MSPSGVTLNKPVAVTFMVLVAGGIVFYKYYWKKETTVPGRVVEADGVSNKEIDVMTLPDFPVVSPEDLKKVKIVEGELTVQVGGKEFKVYNRQSIPSGSAKLTVLLLHGAAFHSGHWVEINTLQYLASWGYQALAIDLPGSKGKTTGDLGDISRSDFLAAVITTFKSDLKPVIISPSMSGSFALPYLFQDPAKSVERALGYVPIAPVDSETYTDMYPKSQLPTLIVYGTKDSGGPKTAESLKLLPRSQVAAIPDGTHACYLDKSDLFHKALYSFLIKLNPA